MYTLGKVLWELMTNRQPYPAEDPDLAEPKLKKYSSLLQNFVSSLIKEQYSSFEQAKEVVNSYISSQNTIVDGPKIFNIFNNIPIKKLEIAKKVAAPQFFDL